MFELYPFWDLRSDRLSGERQSVSDLAAVGADPLSARNDEAAIVELACW
jgi:hypothetical protein